MVISIISVQYDGGLLLDIILIIIIIISAHKSDLSNPWSQTQASLSIPSLHPKNTLLTQYYYHHHRGTRLNAMKSFCISSP